MKENFYLMDQEISLHENIFLHNKNLNFNKTPHQKMHELCKILLNSLFEIYISL